MKYVYLSDGVVADRSQIDPYKVFNSGYASQFIEAPDQVDFGWELQDGVWISPPPPDSALFNKSQAEQLLQATDWVEVPSVSNTANTPHLINYQEFITYRLAVRAIAVNPPTEPATFPTKPEENWSSV